MKSKPLHLRDPARKHGARGTGPIYVRVLLITDERCTAPRAAKMLGSATMHPMATAASLRELEAALSQSSFDVVLLEAARVTGDTIAAIKRILQLAPGLPVVVLVETACDQADQCVEALGAGAQDVLLKDGTTTPLLMRSLRFAIERQGAHNDALARLGRAEEARDRAERGEHRAVLAATASTALSASLDFESTLHAVAGQAVRELADFCIIDLLDDDGTARRVVVAHADAEQAPLADLLSRFPLDRSRPHLMFDVLRTRAPVLMEEVSREYLISIAQSEEHLSVLERLAPRSLIAIPLLARERLLGAVIFARVRDPVPYGPEDVGAAEDLADRAALAIDNARLYTEAREAIAARNSVLRVVAHDLRNPLNAISMSADLLLDAPLASDPLVKRVQVIRRAAQQMDRLIQDLLDVVRLDAGQLVLTRTLVSPAHVAHQAVELNTPLADARSLTLVCETADVLPPIEADVPRILQVLGNLIDNAIKFTPAGGEIRVTATAEDSEVRFSVRDTGIGIEPNDLAHLFRYFWQARRGGKEGAGLGLAISKAIIEAHGGRIWAESTVGEGSTFHIVVPAAVDRRRHG